MIRKLVLFVVAVVATSTAIMLATPNTTPYDALPQCQEDEVLIGFGDFEGGRWNSYACGPAFELSELQGRDYAGG